jgi:hypothetical protein
VIVVEREPRPSQLSVTPFFHSKGG